jgi:hydroxymethylpyrimidine pyrophosphatase-like HAD family hydrolase
VETFAIPVPTAQDAARRVREVLPDAAFGMETEKGFAHEARYRPRWNPEPLLGVGPIEEHFNDSIAKLLVRDDVLSGDAMLGVAAPVLDGVVEVTHSNVNDSLLELSALGVTKATTLERLADRWGILQDEVVAFGDMPNDVQMLRWAGTGYAVGNAHPTVLAAADAHAPSIDDDGVALVLEELLRL